MLTDSQEAPGILQTIEDFMWFKLALVRPSRGETATTRGYFAAGETCHRVIFKLT